MSDIPVAGPEERASERVRGQGTHGQVQAALQHPRQDMEDVRHRPGRLLGRGRVRPRLLLDRSASGRRRDPLLAPRPPRAPLQEALRALRSGFRRRRTLIDHSL